MTAFRIAPAGGAMTEVAALFREYADFLGVDLSLQGFGRELAGLPGDYAPPRGALLLARDPQGAPLGCAALKPLDKEAAEIKRLYVRPAARGLGVGKALLIAILQAATQNGFREVKLDTLPHLHEAHALYRAFGFTPIEPYGVHPFAGQLFFGKRLP